MYEESEQLMMSIGNDIRRLRLLKGLTAITLADRARVSLNAVRHLENDGRASLQTFVKILCALGKQDWIRALAPTISINPLDMPNGKTRRRGKGNKFHE
jgi:transcriptional regulator with XRE-family HTH domain